MYERILAAGAAAFLWAGTAQAAVLRVEIESRAPIAGAFGSAGDYELVKGRYVGELDPKDPKNAIITDLDLAPLNARGRVEYAATFALAKPVDMTKASGVLFYDTPNRGFGRAVDDADGHMHLISGWQGDIPSNLGLQSAQVPIAQGQGGAPVTGPVLVRFIDPPRAASLALTAGLGAGVPRPKPLSLDTSAATLVRRRNDQDRGDVVALGDWAFADCSHSPFPGTPDPGRVCLRAGFDPAFVYELTYTAKDPYVLGIGFAAVRDLVSFLRDTPSKEATPNPVAGKVRWTIATGVSQSGNFLRSFIHLGFNQAEDERQVFDGALPQIAARQVPLNIRFGVPGGAANLYEPGSDGVLWWGWHEDSARGRGRTSLLARCSQSNTCPKVMEVFGSAEFWGLRMSPDLVGFEGASDIPLPTNVRRYYLPSVTHGGGSGGFDLAPQRPPTGCSLPANPNPSAPTVRALTRALVAWVRDDAKPPPSRYPTLAKGELVTPQALAAAFPSIPGAPSPAGKLNPLLVYDFGPGFRYNDLSGVIATVPPRVVREAPSLVPKVNADGNETAGVPSVQLRAPLGTYLGWNEQAQGYYAGAGCGFQGGFIPFARTKAERVAKRDPRPSLEERYGSHEGFVTAVRTAAQALTAEGFLLPHDAEQIVSQAEQSSALTDEPSP